MLKGRCGCGEVTYQMSSGPMFVHCCHCQECQKQTGSAYVLNAIIEADRVEIDGPVIENTLPTPSGKGQVITRCANCGTAVFSNYLVRMGKLRYIRVGTLDDPSQCPPDVQIFTSSKWCCQTNSNASQKTVIAKSYEAQIWNHSFRAAVRFRL